MDFDDLKLDEVMDESVISKTAAGTLQGLVMGTVWGAVVASWKDVPKVERNVAWPGMKRTLLMMGNYGATFAAVGGIFALTDKVSQKLRNKQDFWNGTIGAFVSGAIVIGLRGRSIKYGIQAGTAFGTCVAFMDSTGQTIRVDNGTEYFPYNIITDESE